MKKVNKFKLFIAAAALIGTTASAQLIDEKDVSITLDLQPVLQLDMTTPDQIEFVFDEISEYQAGIVQYAATILKVSSTVTWDLYAVARSQGITGDGFWDQQVSYGIGGQENAINELPLNLLEIKQNTANPATSGVGLDYSSNFTNAIAPNGNNCIYVDETSHLATPPASNEKYIAGHSGTTGTADYVDGGTYLNESGQTSNYYYTIDYRILPGLPAIFPMAYNNEGDTALDLVTANAGVASSYAEPGVYTMYVQYILLEDQ